MIVAIRQRNHNDFEMAKQKKERVELIELVRQAVDNISVEQVRAERRKMAEMAREALERIERERDEILSKVVGQQRRIAQESVRESLRREIAIVTAEFERKLNALEKRTNTSLKKMDEKMDLVKMFKAQGVS